MPIKFKILSFNNFNSMNMTKQIVSSDLAPTDVFERLSRYIGKISRTDGSGFIEAYLENVCVKIKIEPRDHGSKLKISYDFKRYWTMLTIIMLLLIPLFLMIDKFMFGRLDPESVIIPLILLIGWYGMKSYDEGKKKKKILKKLMTLIQ